MVKRGLAFLLCSTLLSISPAGVRGLTATDGSLSIPSEKGGLYEGKRRRKVKSDGNKRRRRQREDKHAFEEVDAVDVDEEVDEIVSAIRNMKDRSAVDTDEAQSQQEKDPTDTIEADTSEAAIPTAKIETEDQVERKGSSHHAESIEEDAPDEPVEEEGMESKAQAAPTPPLFAFPRRPKQGLTAAEEGLDELLPRQQQLMKYLTDDRLFGVQVACSAYALLSAFVHTRTGSAAAFQSCLLACIIKNWGTVAKRLNRVLVPHLLYEPSKYLKFKGRVSALATDPAAQGIVYCALFLWTRPQISKCLLPLIVRELAYMLLAGREMLGILSPSAQSLIDAVMKWPMAVFMTQGDVEKWTTMESEERQVVLGRRVAALCLKIELFLISTILMGILQHSSADENRTLRMVIGVGSILVYQKLLDIKVKQLQGDTYIIKGLRIGGVPLGWLEVGFDTTLFSYMGGFPLWLGLAILPMHLLKPEVMSAVTEKLQGLKGLRNVTAKGIGRRILYLVAGLDLPHHRLNKTTENDETGDESEVPDVEEGSKDLQGMSSLSKATKVTSVALGFTDT